jgi:hypothetical protein
MEGVPLDGIHCQIVALVSLEVLTRVSTRAEMDLTLLGSDQEQLIVEFVEVEAHTSGEAVNEGILFVVRDFLVLVSHKLQLDDLLGLEFVLHQVPGGHTTI